MKFYGISLAMVLMATALVACEEEKAPETTQEAAQTTQTAPASTESLTEASTAAATDAAATSASGPSASVSAGNASVVSYFQCGDTLVEFVPGMNGKGDMRIANTAYAMENVVAASGAKYQNLGDATTYFWNKGDMAMVAINGKDLPECTKTAAPAKPAKPYRAQGNEPGWTVTIEAGDVTFQAGYDDPAIALPVIADQQAAHGIRIIRAQAGGNAAVITMTPQNCQDSMSGEAFAHKVEVSYNEHSYTGCGQSLIRESEWVLEDLNGGGVIDNSHMTLTLGADGRLHGDSGCNYYNGSYTLEGETLGVSPNLVSTMRACVADSLMQQEQAFLKTLAQMTAATLDDTGALVLSGAEGAGSLKFRKTAE